MVNNWINNGQEWWFPSLCVLCGNRGAEGRDLCRGCYEELSWQKNACYRCGIALPADGVCGLCQQYNPAFERTYSVFDYRGPLAHLIHGFKFQKRLGLARLLGGLMAESLRDRIDVMPEVLIPVPLHRSRLRVRGFNQAMELARPVARRLECALVHDGCRRVRPTEAQSLLSADERRRNVQGVFEVTRCFPAGHVAIIDDVMTTGSTVAELAQALRRAGAERVDVWVLARAAL